LRDASVPAAHSEMSSPCRGHPALPVAPLVCAGFEHAPAQVLAGSLLTSGEAAVGDELALAPAAGKNSSRWAIGQAAASPLDEPPGQMAASAIGGPEAAVSHEASCSGRPVVLYLGRAAASAVAAAASRRAALWVIARSKIAKAIAVGVRVSDRGSTLVLRLTCPAAAPSSCKVRLWLQNLGRRHHRRPRAVTLLTRHITVAAGRSAKLVLRSHAFIAASCSRC
jgi:hypothetical protein